LFTLFYSERDFGTGIGLAYCDMIMRKYKGSIECNSEYGEYSEFVLSFPKVRVIKQ
jgi:signal transduction histidine kinase